MLVSLGIDLPQGPAEGDAPAFAIPTIDPFLPWTLLSIGRMGSVSEDHAAETFQGKSEIDTADCRHRSE